MLGKQRNVSTWDPRCFLTITTVPERHTPLMQVFSNIALFVWMVWRVHQWREVLAACLTNGRWWAGLKEYNLFLTELLNSLPPWFLTVFLRRTIVCIFWEPPSWMNPSVSFQETFDNFSFSVTPTSKLHLLMTFSPISYLTSLHGRHMQPNSAWNGKLNQKKKKKERKRERERFIFSEEKGVLGCLGRCYTVSASEIIVLSSIYFFTCFFVKRISLFT